MATTLEPQGHYNSKMSTSTANGVQSLLSSLQIQKPRVHGRSVDRIHHQKPLPERPMRKEALQSDNGKRDAAIDLLPRPLAIYRRNGGSSAQELEDLAKENGYLRAEVDLLKDTRRALSELQGKTREAFLILKGALEQLSEDLSESEQRLMSYWGSHCEDGNEEAQAF